VGGLQALLLQPSDTLTRPKANPGAGHLRFLEFLGRGLHARAALRWPSSLFGIPAFAGVVGLPSLPWLSLFSQSGQTKRSLSSLALFGSTCCSPSRNVLGVACAPHAQILRKGTAIFSLLSTKLLEVCQPQLGADVTLQSSTTMTVSCSHTLKLIQR
jgi:hypothetical protein